MDIKWTYCLIIGIYIVLASIKVLNIILMDNFKKGREVIVFKGFKKDFFTTIAQICVIITLMINGMTIVGQRPLNTGSIIITLLIVGMAIISSSVTIIVEKGTLLNISGYEFKTEDIKEVKAKKKSRWDTYTIRFKEDVNGYENLKLYVIGTEKEALAVELARFETK